MKRLVLIVLLSSFSSSVFADSTSFFASHRAKRAGVSVEDPDNLVRYFAESWLIALAGAEDLVSARKLFMDDLRRTHFDFSGAHSDEEGKIKSSSAEAMANELVNITQASHGRLTLHKLEFELKRIIYTPNLVRLTPFQRCSKLISGTASGAGIVVLRWIGFK